MTAQRIISLVPSQTELLYDLDLGDRVVGITKFCEQPPVWFREKTKVGGTKTANLEKIAALNPDLILCNKEENSREQVEWLAARFPLWMSDIYTLDDALEMIEMVGGLTQTEKKASDLVELIRSSFVSLQQNLGNLKTESCAYLIWQRPTMVAASGTFVDSMLEKAGFVNIFKEKSRYPEVAIQEIVGKQPEWLLLSSEPFPFREKHLSEWKALCPKAQVKLVDGALFSWYGSRLRFAPAYFERLRQSTT